MLLATTTATLEAKPPFDFTQSLRFLGHFAPTRDEQRLAEQSLTKGVRVAGQTVVFRVRSDEPSSLHCTLFSAQSLDQEQRCTALDCVSAFLSLQDDLEPFYAIGRRDPAFAPVIDQLYGYHQVRFLTPFENACWAILTQRTPMTVARIIKDALIDAYGDHLEVDGMHYSAFPEPSTLAAISASSLTSIVGNERRATYILAIAKAFAHVQEGFLHDAPSTELLDWLRSIKGIGPWSASFILLRGFGRTDLMPLDEERLLQAAQQRYGADRVVDRASVATLADSYGPWKGYWAHYLRVAS